MPGTMSLAWQIMTPPFDWDLASTGRAESRLGVLDLLQHRDGPRPPRSQREPAGPRLQRGRELEAAPTPRRTAKRRSSPACAYSIRKVPGIMYFLPFGKSPHGADTIRTDGLVCNGKLAPYMTVFNFAKLQAAATT